MIGNYFKIAFRSLWKARTTSLINIAGLSVGMTAAVLILLWVMNEMNFDDQHSNPERIFRVTTHLKTNNWVWESSPLLLADAIKRDIPEVDHVTRLNANQWPVFSVHDKTFYQKNCAFVDSGWFNIFHFDFVEGNAARFGNGEAGIILSASEAKKYFGNAPAVGQSIQVDRSSHEVLAVIADPPVNSSFNYHAFLPISSLLQDPAIKANDEQWNNFNYISFIRIREGANTKAVSSKIEAILKQNDPEVGAGTSLLPISKLHFETGIQNSSFPHGNINTVYVFSILAGLLLLIACINYVNLTTAKASLRSREVSVRKITGASRGQLFVQFMTESLLVSLIALFATLCLVRIALPVFNELTGVQFKLPLYAPELWQTTGLTLLIAFALNSVYPALVLSSFKPINVFRGASLLKVKDSYFRKGLVILQFTVSIILVAGTIIIYRQMNFIQQSHPGYNRSELISFAVPRSIDRERRPAAMETIRQQLLASPGITDVSTSNQPLANLGSMCMECVDWEGRDTGFINKVSQIEVAQLAVDAGFQKTLQLTMKEGRWFDGANTSDRHNVVLNETAVRSFDLKQPVTGKRFIFSGDTGLIIGVVKDFKFRSMHEKTGPLVAFANPAVRNHFTVRAGAGNASAAVAAIERMWKTSFPGVPLEYNFMDDTFNNLYKKDQQASFLVLVFAGIAIVLSALGLFGLATFSAEQRTKEIGIRKVLGATVFNLAKLLSSEFLLLVLIALVLATPVAYWAMTQWLQGFAYKIHISWWMFAAAGMLAVFVAIVTVSYQAIKAALANPVRSLRSE